MTLPATKRDVLLTASSEAASLMEVITRASRDTTVDVSKFKELMAMYRDLERQKAEEAFNEAMSKTQEEMEPIAKDARGEKGMYASYAALDKALRPIYTKHDLSLSFNTASTQHENEVLVLCYVTRGGYTREYSIPMPADGKGPRGNDVMTRTHATGSAVTYGMRYLLKMIFNVAVEQDDDGKAAGRTRPAPPRPPTESQFITPIQVDVLRAMLDRSPERERMFRAAYLGGAPMEDIASADFERCKAKIQAVNSHRARQATQAPTDAFSPKGEGYMPPKLKGASTVTVGTYTAGGAGTYIASGGGGGAADPYTSRTELVDPDTEEVTAPARPTQRRPAPQVGSEEHMDAHQYGRVEAPPTQRSRPPRPQSSAAAPAVPRFSTVENASSASPDLPWEDQVNALVEDKPPAIANINILMKWQASCFELMPDKETAAEFHWEHIHADGPSRWLRDIPHPANADALQGAWNLLMKRWE